MFIFTIVFKKYFFHYPVYILSGIVCGIFRSLLPYLYSEDIWQYGMAFLLCAVAVSFVMFSSSNDIATKYPHCVSLPYSVHMFEQPLGINCVFI